MFSLADQLAEIGDHTLTSWAIESCQLTLSLLGELNRPGQVLLRRLQAGAWPLHRD
jgi:hypothetical protein